ncbi:hypothetical protein [Metabacillus niabensis]|uniref:Uncharacterized protein n=1 Tax=Metabacillus niabensis TaxID=324854 RepID=A0ABT9Z153_9BACI|nr:hypothetical protein [Metabacillus niabensis]MDQ0225976.1 hypothetical protein [Metabacillus niabensis]
MIQTFISALLASSLVMKYNLNWHRKLLFISIPLFIIFMFIQAEYVNYRVKDRLYERS